MRECPCALDIAKGRAESVDLDEAESEIDGDELWIDGNMVDRGRAAKTFVESVEGSEGRMVEVDVVDGNGGL